MSYKTVENYLVKARTGKKLKKVKGIVVHWVGNPNSTAQGNRNYWERRGDGVSAHDIIDIDGNLMRCVPYSDMCYHVGSPKGYTPRALKELSAYPNDCTVGVECTHINWDGEMTPKTYNTLVEHVAKLCKQFGLTTANVYTHHEIVGDYKDCHRWFTNNPAEWKKFKAKVEALLKPAPTKPATPAKPAPSKPAKSPIVLPTGVLKVGNKGDAVKKLQTALNLLKFKVDKVDGVYGQDTKDAVYRFQSVYCNPADGIYGPATRAAMQKRLAK